MILSTSQFYCFRSCIFLTDFSDHCYYICSKINLSLCNKNTVMMCSRTLSWYSSHVLRFSVENAYLEEKEDTCNALGEIAENMGYVPRQWLVHTRHACQVLSLVYITETQFSLIIGSHFLRFDGLVVFSSSLWHRAQFLPYIDDCYREVNLLSEVWNQNFEFEF